MRKHARSYYLIEHNQQLPELEPKASNHNEVNSNNQSVSSSQPTSNDDWFQLLEETSPEICWRHGQNQNQHFNKRK